MPARGLPCQASHRSSTHMVCWLLDTSWLLRVLYSTVLLRFRIRARDQASSVQVTAPRGHLESSRRRDKRPDCFPNGSTPISPQPISSPPSMRALCRSAVAVSLTIWLCRVSLWDGGSESASLDFLELLLRVHCCVLVQRVWRRRFRQVPLHGRHELSSGPYLFLWSSCSHWPSFWALPWFQQRKHTR